MKKIKQLFIIWVITILIATFGIADQGTLGTTNTGSIDDECKANGFDYGIVKFEWNGTTNSHEPELPPVYGYIIAVTGNTSTAYWTADPGVCGVLHKESQNTYIHLGGTTGTVDYNIHGISHITFCGCETPTPEFTTLTMALMIMLISPAFAYLLIKKRK